MKLFNYEGYNLKVEPEALLLTPFKKLWDRDKSKLKETAMQEFAYIYFMEDPRSDFLYMTDRDDRSKAIISGEGIDPKWKPDKEVMAAMEYYSTFKPSSALLLEDTRTAVDKLRSLLRDIDLSKTDNSGKPIYTLNAVTTAIKQIPQLVKDLDQAEKTLSKDLTQSDKVQGSTDKAIFEDI